MDRKNVSSAFQWVVGFLVESFTCMSRVNICGCLVEDETVHFQQ